MTIGTFLQVRDFLDQISAASLADQLGFLQMANSSIAGPMSDPLLSDLRTTVKGLLQPNGNPSTSPTHAVQWTRWRDARDQSGVALMLAAARLRYVLLPNKADPPSILFDQPLPGSSFILLPTVETLARTEGIYLTYVHKDLLLMTPRPADDSKPYTRMLRMIESGLPVPVPLFRGERGRPGLHWIEELHGGVHGALFAVQKGMEFVLGQVKLGTIPLDAIPLIGAARSYPSYGSLLSEGPDLKDALPADACFGGGDPLYQKPSLSLRERKMLRDADGNEIGWAYLVSGGRNGRHADAASGLSAATSAGGRDHQEDGFYIAHFRAPGGRDVRVLAGADGLGGHERGELASSAALLGVHAGLLRALREGRLPLAGDLFDQANEALEAQTLFEEFARESPFKSDQMPDTVIAVSVVVDGEATIATSGDFLVLLCARGPDGWVRALGHTVVDAANDYAVSNTLKSGRKHLFRARLPPDSWLVAASDGAMGGLVPSFKKFTAPQYREETLSSLPEQGLFYNLLHVLEHTPPHYAGPALHDVASGSTVIPDDGEDPDAERPEYPALGTIAPETDNWTVGVLHWKESQKAPALEIPASYGPLEEVHPTYQYVFPDGPYTVHMPWQFRELFVGSAPHPEGRPMIVLRRDPGLARTHVRIERISGDPTERFFIEKLVGSGRVVLLSPDDKPVATLTRKGSRREILPNQLVHLTPRTFFRFRGTL
jgi:hypothetical protein